MGNITKTYIFSIFGAWAFSHFLPFTFSQFPFLDPFFMHDKVRHGRYLTPDSPQEHCWASLCSRTDKKTASIWPLKPVTTPRRPVAMPLAGDGAPPASNGALLASDGAPRSVTTPLQPVTAPLRPVPDGAIPAGDGAPPARDGAPS